MEVAIEFFVGDFHKYFFAVKKYLFLEFRGRIVVSMSKWFTLQGLRQKIGAAQLLFFNWRQLVGGCNPASPAIQKINWNSSSIFSKHQNLNDACEWF